MESPTKEISILLVEDDAVDAQAVIRQFQIAGVPIHFYLAKDGEAAFNMLYGKNGESMISPTPQAIILDTNMPKMNGIEFLTQLRLNPQFEDIPVFMLTGEFSTREQLTAHHLKVTARIIKPLQPQDVQHIYSVILERHQG